MRIAAPGTRDRALQLNPLAGEAEIAAFIEATKPRFASICSKPGMCSDDGRALTLGWYVYTAAKRDQKFWNEPRYFNTEREAREWCAAQCLEITGTSWL